MSLQVAKRKKKWKEAEDKLRAEKAEKLESSSSTSSLYGAGTDTAKGRQPKQIFSSVAASGVLTNDLVDIMETVKETGKREVVGCSVVVIRTLTEGIVADTVEDNIFQWNVKMSQFS